MNGETLKTIGRRDFLTAGSAALVSAAVPWAPAFASTPKANRAPAMAPTPASPLVIGYWEGSEICANLSRIAPEAWTEWRLVRADSLRQGDARFAGQNARIVIHGLRGREAGKQTLDLASLAIQAHYAPFHEGVYHAWRFGKAAQGALRHVSGGVSFFVPVDGAAGLRFEMVVVEAAGREAVRVPVQFSLGRQPDLPKLRRGVYSIGVGSLASCANCAVAMSVEASS